MKDGRKTVKSDRPSVIYKLRTERRRGELRIEAEPSRFACGIHGEILFPGRPLALREQTEPRIEVSWGCGGMHFNIVDARQFFRAGLKVCDALELALKRKGRKK